MKVKRSQVGWRFGILWMLLTTIGWHIGWIIGFVLGNFLLGNIMLGTGIGAGVGFMQWLALRRFVHRSGWWVLANIAGLTVCLSLYAIVHTVTGIPFDLGLPLGILGWALAFAVGGTMTGVLQQRILRRHVGRSIWWVLASTLGWALSIFVMGGLLVGPVTARELTMARQIGSMFGGGVVLALVTVVAMIWLLRQPVPEA